jgi:uncharacterized RDD family membrane protein YckC
MRCPACGARYAKRSARCPECGALQDESPIECSAQEPVSIEAAEETVSTPVEKTVPTSSSKRKRRVAKTPRSLLEFPGVNRNAMPEWRKELGERVREVQERRAREALLETAEIGPLFSDLDARNAPVLELLPQAEMPPINPLVVAALQRIERARAQVGRGGGVATAIAYEQQPAEEINLPAAQPIDEIVPKPERVHTLAVVPNSELMSAELPRKSPRPEPKKATRIIGEQNDPALNYLDAIPRSVLVERSEYACASVFRRLFGALIDLAVVGVLAAPLLALTELTTLQWQNPRVIGFGVGTLLVVGFLYLTLSVAFTGRTIGMKLLSLRVVDARNGLIPTGRQSAARSFLYLLSLVGAGVTLLYTFVDTEKQTVHDRFTRTVVIRA